MWPADYIGIPYVDRGRTHEGSDCWGIAALVNREVFKKHSFPLLNDTYPTTDDLTAVNETYENNKNRFTEVTFHNRCPGDILMFIIKGFPVHVGVACDYMYMLHSLPNMNCVYENYTTFKWEKRLVGIYRWEE